MNFCFYFVKWKKFVALLRLNFKNQKEPKYCPDISKLFFSFTEEKSSTLKTSWEFETVIHFLQCPGVTWRCHFLQVLDRSCLLMIRWSLSLSSWDPSDTWNRKQHYTWDAGVRINQRKTRRRDPTASQQDVVEASADRFIHIKAQRFEWHGEIFLFLLTTSSLWIWETSSSFRHFICFIKGKQNIFKFLFI